MRVLPIVVATALAVGACGGADDGDNGEPVLGGKMSVEELAGKMAVSEREAGEILDQLDDSGCADDGAQQPLCGKILDISSYVADTVVITLGRVLPAGVEALADESREAAQAVVDKHKEWDGAGCATSTTEECTTLSRDLTGAVETLHEQLEEWSQHVK